MRALTKVSNRIYSELVNSANDADNLRKVGYQDDGYSFGPDIKRVKMKVEKEAKAPKEEIEDLET